MTLAPSIRLPARSDRAVRTIARSWRRLTGGTDRGLDRARRTLIACSGGADSCGLVLALAAAASEPAGIFVVGHIVHDMRPLEQSLADRDAARGLAAALGLPFVEAAIGVRLAGGNAEGVARRLRYRALAKLAAEIECPYIATAHHEDDQLESVLMALLRGAGPRGLSGVGARRRAAGLSLIRPALGVGRAELQRLCREAGWVWREDATNSDRTRLRAAVRHGILPELKRLRPGAASRVTRSAALLRDATGLIRDRVQDLLAEAMPRSASGPPALSWTRARLRGERAVVVGALLKEGCRQLAGDRGRDRLGSAALEPVARAIRSARGEPRRFRLAGFEVAVEAAVVRLGRAELA